MTSEGEPIKAMQSSACVVCLMTSSELDMIRQHSLSLEMPTACHVYPSENQKNMMRTIYSTKVCVIRCVKRCVKSMKIINATLFHRLLPCRIEILGVTTARQGTTSACAFRSSSWLRRVSVYLGRLVQQIL